MHDITILPCPFCLHDDVEISTLYREQIAVYCPQCGAFGPDGRDTMSAVMLWNRRHVEGESS